LRIETARLGQETTDPALVPDVNRLLLEESFPSELAARPALLIEVESDWVRPAAERLRDALLARGLRARVSSLRPYMRTPVSQMVTADQTMNIDGFRLWRGDLVRPGVIVDAPLVLLGGERGLIRELLAGALLPEPISDNMPGRGRAILNWLRQPFSLDHDTVAVLANDAEGLMAGVEALLDPDAPATVVTRWQPGQEAPAAPADQPATVETVGRVTDIERFSEQVGYRDRVETLAVDPESGRIVIGTDGHGHNLFCFSADGDLQWKTFLPEHGVYTLSWIDGGRRIVAATGHGWWLFIIDPAEGRVTSRVSLTEWPDFQVKDRPTRTQVKIVDNPPLRQLLVLGRTGMQAIDYDGSLLWFHDRAFEVVRYPQEAEQLAFAEFGEYLKILDVAPSPDGRRLIYNEQRSFASTTVMMQAIPLWRNEPQILDARTGAVLLHSTEDPGANDPWLVSWPDNDQDPLVHTRTLSARLSFSGTPPDDGPDPGRLGSFVPPDTGRLAAGTRLTKTYRDARLFDAHNLPVWQRRDHEHYLIALDRLNAAQTRLYRCSREGIVRCIDMQSGATIWEHDLGLWARLESLAGDELLAGGRGGLITRFSAGGQVLWQIRLGDLHEPPAGDYPGYIAAAVARDAAVHRETFLRSVDAPGDYDGILRMGLEQLDNGDFAEDQGWTTQTGELVIDDAAAHTGARSLRVADGQLVTSRVQRRVVRGATYLLEFHYRPEQAGVVLAAGTALLGDETVLTASNFQAEPGTWRFGRVAIKAHLDTVKIDVGFEASGGAVRVDGVSLRPVRFPSANLLADEELHRIEPTHAESFRIQYERFPQGMRESLMRRNKVSAFLQEIPLGSLVFLEDAAFLQNGRLDDVGQMWCYRHEPVGFAVTLTQPAHVSHLVIYLNNTAPELAYPFISIQANDLEIKVPKTVALVRGNGRRFIVVHFPGTIHTDHFKILPGRYPSRHDAITEIEVYGPVGGPEMLVDKRFTDDPLAVPMLMGNPAHVIARPAPDLVGSYRAQSLMNAPQAASYRSAVTVADGFMSFAHASGSIQRVPVNDAARQAWDATVEEARRQGRQPPSRQWGLASVTPLGTPARYAGRLLVGSADYQMHAVADNGTRIWRFPTEGRIYSSPTPADDEVFFGSDDGNLYKVDVDSGILVWEFKTGGRVRGAPALDDKTVYVPSWDGLLHAIDRERGQVVWTAPLAPDTSAAPALHGGRVYIGDEDGTLHCLDAATGQSIWQVALGGPMPKGISAVPVITESGILVVTDGGQAARVGFDGQIIWNRDLMADRRDGPVPPWMNSQPYPTRSQLLVPMNQGLLVLRQEDGLPDERFVPPEGGGNVLSAVPYGDSIVVIRDQAQVQGDWMRFIVGMAADAMVWLPVKEENNP
jgi:outer membrane protein assembly factor BamB